MKRKNYKRNVQIESKTVMVGLSVNRLLWLVVFITTVVGCVPHKGAVKPNASLADFNKYGKAYYLSLDQIDIGNSKKEVIEAYGQEYSEDLTPGGLTIWIFESYRATFASDPVEKLVTVVFKNDVVIEKSETYLNASIPVESTEQGIAERLRELKSLRDDDVISESDYQNKKAELLKEF